MRGKSKYGNVKSGGHASKKEADRAATLKLLERAGKIKDLQEQVTYTLIPAQFEGEGKNGHCVELACKYVADFVYTDVETGETVVEDTKGFRTDVYKIKRKLMLKVHGIKIKET